MGTLIELVGIGVDVEDIDRWHDLLSRIPARQLDTMFSAGEQASCNAGGDPASAYAGKWCAKEEVRKATASLAPLTLRRIIVLNEPSGAPRVTIEDGPVVFDQVEVQVSITHSASSAAAVAIAFRTGTRGPMPQRG